MKTVAQLKAEYAKVAKRAWVGAELERLTELVKAGINSASWIRANDETFKGRTVAAISEQMRRIRNEKIN